MDEYRVVSYDGVSKYVMDIIVKAADCACRINGFDGAKPDFELSDKPFEYPNGDKYSFAYNFKTRAVKIDTTGVIGSGLCKAGLMFPPALSAYVGHEMEHHFQNERKDPGISEIMVSSAAARKEIADHPLEQEANKMGEKVVKKLYGIGLNWIE